MKIASRTESGLLLLSVAIALMLTTTLASETIVAAGWSASLSLSDQTVVWSTLGLGFPVLAFVIGTTGFGGVWRGQRTSGRGPPSALLLSRWAGIAGVASFGALALTGLLLGVLYVQEPLRGTVWIAGVVLAPLGALAIGLFLLWAVRDLTSPGIARISVSAFGLGAAATSLSFVRVLEMVATEPAALTMFWAERLTALVSMTLWLFVFLSTAKRLRAGTATRPLSPVPT